MNKEEQNSRPPAVLDMGQIARTLDAEFVCTFRAGGNYAPWQEVADFLGRHFTDHLTPPSAPAQNAALAERLRIIAAWVADWNREAHDDIHKAITALESPASAPNEDGAQVREAVPVVPAWAVKASQEVVRAIVFRMSTFTATVGEQEYAAIIARHAREAAPAKDAELESFYGKVVAVALKCDPVPACKRADRRLEPPWEVFERIRQELAHLRSTQFAWTPCSGPGGRMPTREDGGLDEKVLWQIRFLSGKIEVSLADWDAHWSNERIAWSPIPAYAPVADGAVLLEKITDQLVMESPCDYLDDRNTALHRHAWKKVAERLMKILSPPPHPAPSATKAKEGAS